MSCSRGLPPRCCRCNGTAKCLRFACVRAGSPCSRCLPGDAGNCRNTTPRLPCGPSTPLPPGSNTSPPSGHHSRGSSAVAPAVQRPDPSSPPTVCFELPSLTNIFQAPCRTLKHVPKGVRDRWARVFKECLSAVCDAPADLSRWSKLFMLAKCVLASPATGHRLRWREILALVRSRIDRWLAGDLVALCLEAVAGGKSLAKRVQSSSVSQQSSNIRRAKLAVQDGQYSKAIKALTSDGLATPSAEVLEEMLGKHTQVAPPNLPSAWSGATSIHCERVSSQKGVRSFPNGSAPGPSGLRPSHLREAVVLSLPGQG